MSMAAERSRAAPGEPDRLTGFSTPREVDRLFGHEAALNEFADARESGRMHHAWLLVGPEGIGKATLAYRFARSVLAEGETVDADHPVFRKVTALAPEPSPHPALVGREVEALFAMDRHRRGEAAQGLSRQYGGR
jgi:DNA polymerase-3 subunit delta'